MIWLLHRAALSVQECSRPGRRLGSQGRAVVQCSRCFLHTWPLKCDRACVSSKPDQLMWCNTSEADRSSPAHRTLN